MRSLPNRMMIWLLYSVGGAVLFTLGVLVGGVSFQMEMIRELFTVREHRRGWPITPNRGQTR